jgi:glutaconate CoA-transferase subunit B
MEALGSAAAMLARAGHAAELARVHGARPAYAPLAAANGILAKTAVNVVSVPERFHYWLQPGRIDVGLLGADLVDRMGDINSAVIGDYNRPTVRLPDAGGAPEIGAAARGSIALVQQSERGLAGVVAFVSTVGGGPAAGDRKRFGPLGEGPTTIVTDLGVCEPDSDNAAPRLAALQAGGTATSAKARTGWNLEVAPNVAMRPTPTERERATPRGFERAAG